MLHKLRITTGIGKALDTQYTIYCVKTNEESRLKLWSRTQQLNHYNPHIPGSAIPKDHGTLGVGMPD